MMDRETLEVESRKASGVIESVGPYHWVKVLNGPEMYVHKADLSVTPHLVNDGFWESWVTTWFFNHIRSGVVFWDIGANTGYYSLLAYYLGAQVHAFEPNPVYAEMLRATEERNGLGSLFRISEIALSDYNGEAVLNIPTSLHGSASLNDIPPGYDFDRVEVKVSSLDEYVDGAGAGIQVLKIDAEGEEERILRGARRFLDSTPHRRVLLEYTPGAYSEHFLGDLFAKWSVSWINHDGEAEPVTPEWILEQTDWVMLVLQ